MSEEGQVVGTMQPPPQMVVVQQKKKGRGFGSRFFHWMTDKDPNAIHAKKRVGA